MVIICDGFVFYMLIMKNIDIEVVIVWVGVGVIVKDFDDVICFWGFVVVNGFCIDVGVIGFMLGGGFGFFSRI